MKYDWKCRLCGLVIEVERSVADSGVRPHEHEYEVKTCQHAWDRYFNKDTIPKVPFQHLRHAGIFMDEHGNYAPRNV